MFPGEVPRSVQAVLARVGAVGAAVAGRRARGARRVGADGRAGRRAVPRVLPQPRPALAAGRGDGRARRAARHRRHQHPRAAKVCNATDASDAAFPVGESENVVSFRYRTAAATNILNAILMS